MQSAHHVRILALNDIDGMSSAFAKYILNVNDVSGLENHLRGLGFLKPKEKIGTVAKAGEGNMNCTLRATTTERTFILKQSRPWAEKYPTVPAPLERTESEAWFYEQVRKNEVLASYTPEILVHDSENHLLIMEDLGPSSDFSWLYKKGAILEKADMLAVITVVSELHSKFNIGTMKDRMENKAMRKLNHQHIFELPLREDSGFDLDMVMEGLQACTKKFRTDKKLRSIANELGDIYLNMEGAKLIHGDYYPGSWLRTENGFKVIDPEFCFFGPAEFELAVAVAHLKMADQPDSLIKDLFVYYHFDAQFDGSLFTKFVGMEIIRRLIGLAQLPLEMDKKERLSLLEEAYEFAVNG